MQLLAEGCFFGTSQEPRFPSCSMIRRNFGAPKTAKLELSTQHSILSTDLSPPIRIAEHVRVDRPRRPIEDHHAFEVVVAADVDAARWAELRLRGAMGVAGYDQREALGVFFKDVFQAAIAGEGFPQELVESLGRCNPRKAQAVERGMMRHDQNVL